MKPDKITLDRIDLLHPKIREEVRDIYLNKILPALSGRATCRFAYTLRTFKEQDDLYAQGRTKLYDSAGHRLGVISNSKSGQSYHNFGLALDIMLIVDNKTASWYTVTDFDKDGNSDWMEVINIFKAAGYTSGLDFKSFKDAPHLEKTFGLGWRDCLALKNSGKVDSNGYILI